jgi:hypothetical protein
MRIRLKNLISGIHVPGHPVIVGRKDSRAHILRFMLPALLILPVATCQAAAVDFQTKTLPNGVQIIYKVQPRMDTVCARIVFPAGLLHEHEQARGISHLLEHLIYRGSAKTAPSELYKLIDDQGGYRNGFVYPDRTEFYMEVLPANFLAALAIYSNFILQPALTEPDIRLEKKIIAVENALRAVPGNVFYLYMNELTQHQFDVSLTNIGKDDLSKYHRQFYRTDGMTVILTGAFKPEEVFKFLGSLPPSSEPALPPAEWLFHDPISNIVLEDYLTGEKYRVLFGFDLKNPSPRELIVAKVLPYILKYESHQYDHVNDRPLDYGISLFGLSGHYFLVFLYRDPANPYSLDIDEWHQKNLARYFKYLQAKDFEPFLAKFTKFQTKFLETLEFDPGALNEYLTRARFDPAEITAADLGVIRRLSSKDFKNFVQKHLAGKYYQKIIVKSR